MMAIVTNRDLLIGIVISLAVIICTVAIVDFLTYTPVRLRPRKRSRLPGYHSRQNKRFRHEQDVMVEEAKIAAAEMIEVAVACDPTVVL